MAKDKEPLPSSTPETRTTTHNPVNNPTRDPAHNPAHDPANNPVHQTPRSQHDPANPSARHDQANPSTHDPVHERPMPPPEPTQITGGTARIGVLIANDDVLDYAVTNLQQAGMNVADILRKTRMVLGEVPHEKLDGLTNVRGVSFVEPY